MNKQNLIDIIAALRTTGNIVVEGILFFVPCLNKGEFFENAFYALNMDKEANHGRAAHGDFKNSTVKELESLKPFIDTTKVKNCIAVDTDSFPSDDGLQFVLAHEVGHSVFNHNEEQGKYAGTNAYTVWYIQKEIAADNYAIGVTDDPKTGLRELTRVCEYVTSRSDKLPTLVKLEAMFRQKNFKNYIDLIESIPK